MAGALKRISLAIILFIAATSQTLGSLVTFYEKPGFQGAILSIDVAENQCSNLNWDYEVSSVNTHGTCILAWDEEDCTGNSIQLDPESQGHLTLQFLGNQSKIVSIQQCTSESESAAYEILRNSDLSDLQMAYLLEVAVTEHNSARNRHGSPRLNGNIKEELQHTAQNYANHLARTNSFDHSNHPNYGENLAWTCRGKNQPEAVREAVNMWYSEESEYDYNNPGFSSETEHFTAVVWKNTTQVGIGVAWSSKKKWWVIVANYYPKGNVHGRFRENVERPR